MFLNILVFLMVQAETLETILGVPRNNSGFYPEPDSRAGKEVGNKQGNIPESLHGKSASIFKHLLSHHTCETISGSSSKPAFVCVLEGERPLMLPGQRSAYQRALSMDAKPMVGEGAVGGGLATRRNAPCPTLVKQENMDVPIRPGVMPNGFPGGMGCPPRGNPTSNLIPYYFACPTSPVQNAAFTVLPNTWTKHIMFMLLCVAQGAFAEAWVFISALPWQGLGNGEDQGPVVAL